MASLTSPNPVVPGEGARAALRHTAVVLPLFLAAILFAGFRAHHRLGVDFHYSFWVAGVRVRDGLSPYGWSRTQILAGASFPYPALGALLFVPFSLITRSTADLIFTVLCLLSCVTALRLVGVRDARIYALTLVICPVVTAWQTANVTLPLMLGLAAMWRYRDEPVGAALLGATMLAIKPVVWPILIWMLATRRVRAAIYIVLIAAVMNAAAWTVLGLGEVAAWWHLLALQTSIMFDRGYGLTALAIQLGAGRTCGTALEALATIGLIGLAVRLASQHRDREVLAVTITTMLVASPLVDSHYFAWLLIPLAIARPCLSWPWALPCLLWLCPVSNAQTWQVLIGWIVASAITGFCISSARRVGRTSAAV